VALAFINDSFTVNASGGTTTGTRPTSVGSGNLLYAKWDIYDVDATTGTSLPTGWTLITKNYVTNASGAVTQILAWADGAATLAFVGPSNYTNLYLAGYSGQNASAPIDSGSGAPTFNSGRSTTGTGTGVTVTDNGSLLIYAETGYGAGLSSGPGGTAREVNYDGVNNVYEFAVNSGATGNKTGTLSSTDLWGVGMFVVRPAGSGSTDGTGAALYSSWGSSGAAAESMSATGAPSYSAWASAAAVSESASVAGAAAYSSWAAAGVAGESTSGSCAASFAAWKASGAAALSMSAAGAPSYAGWSAAAAASESADAPGGGFYDAWQASGVVDGLGSTTGVGNGLYSAWAAAGAGSLSMGVVGAPVYAGWASAGGASEGSSVVGAASFSAWSLAGSEDLPGTGFYIGVLIVPGHIGVLIRVG
jgi:hypothetical protein